MALMPVAWTKPKAKTITPRKIEPPGPSMVALWPRHIHWSSSPIREQAS
ncbi:MAG TPA: hypothetical protein VEA80_18470 [Vitreimonas sp.]|nr:hypothetical protein [Vitreimonas sp.]